MLWWHQKRSTFALGACILFSLPKSPLMHWRRCLIGEGRFIKHDLPAWLILLTLSFMCLEISSTASTKCKSLLWHLSAKMREGEMLGDRNIFCLSLLILLPSYRISIVMSCVPYQHLTGDFNSLHSLAERLSPTREKKDSRKHQ